MKTQKYFIMTSYGKVYAENKKGDPYWTFQDDLAKQMTFEDAQEKASDIELDGVSCYVERVE